MVRSKESTPENSAMDISANSTMKEEALKTAKRKTSTSDPDRKNETSISMEISAIKEEESDEERDRQRQVKRQRQRSASPEIGQQLPQSQAPQETTMAMETSIVKTEDPESSIPASQSVQKSDVNGDKEDDEIEVEGEISRSRRKSKKDQAKSQNADAAAQEGNQAIKTEPVDANTTAPDADGNAAENDENEVVRTDSDAAPKDKRKVNVKVKDQHGREMTFEIRYSTELGKVKKAYKKALAKPNHDFRYRIFGDAFKDEDTLTGLKIEDPEDGLIEIEAFEYMLGGAPSCFQI